MLLSFLFIYILQIFKRIVLGDKLKQKYEVGDVVIFIKKASTVDTEVPVGARGIVCDYCEGEMFPYYVTFNNVGNADWFDEDELVTVGTINVK